MTAETKNRKPKAFKIQVGNRILSYGRNLMDMDDSTDLYSNGRFASLRKKLEQKGYIFVRGVVPLNDVMNARKLILRQAALDGAILESNSMSYLNGIITKKKKLPS